MISVPNHLQRLNGNKGGFILLLILILFSCSATKKTLENKNVQIVPSVKDKGMEAESVEEEADVPPLGDTVSPAPRTRGVEPQTKVIPDTIVWTDISDKMPPISSLDEGEVSFDHAIRLKSSYHVKLLIPINSNSTTPPEESRFVHFYAGVLLAMKELAHEGIRLDLDVIDTEEGAWEISDRLDKVLSQRPDVIIGPFDKENLQNIVDTARTLGIPVISPFYTSTKLTQENPFYIQLRPNLKDYIKKSPEYCTSHFDEGEVAVLVRPDQASTSWINYFQDVARTQLKNNRNFYVPYVVTADSMLSGQFAYTRLMENRDIKALIIPNYSYGDESFIYESLRKLMAEKSREIAVIGMPIVFESEKIDFDFYHGLSMKIVMSDFVNTDFRKMGDFRRRYLDEYGHIPTNDAVKGYDLMLYTGRKLWKYGVYFQYYLGEQSEELLQSIFKIEKSYSEDSPLLNDPYKFDFFENKHLDIIEFKGDNWIKIWK